MEPQSLCDRRSHWRDGRLEDGQEESIPGANIGARSITGGIYMSRQQGFTLIEIMIVVAVIAILAAIALPSYNEYVRKSRRSEAARFVGELQLGLERWRAENPSYANCAGAACGSGIYPVMPPAAASPYYAVSVAATGTNYTITAAPRTGSAQAGDRCGNLTLPKSGKPTWALGSCN